jgi:hypothetical protein
MKGHGAKLPRLQEAAIDALLSLGNRNHIEVAATIGISTRTLRRWMESPDFKDAYLRARRQVVSQSNGRVQQATAMASLLLVKIMSDPSVKPAQRLQAAKIVMELAGKSLESDDILVRLDRLEKERANGSPTKTEYRWEDTPGRLEDEETGT